MSFKKMDSPLYPPRQWAIYGDPGSGKSRFASQMKGPALIIDSDGRFTEQIRNAPGQIYKLSDEHTDNLDSDKVARLLKENMPGSGVRTIVVDSLTAILKPIINAALSDIEHGRAKNKVAAFRDKAATMSQIQDAVSGWGVDSLWIWHTHESRNAQAVIVKRASIPETELTRLRRSLNAILKLEVDANGIRSVFVEWARSGKSGVRLVDKAGGWKGMPELIEAAIYSEGIKEGKPTSFVGPQDAVAWGYEQGCFGASQHAQSAYDKLKSEKKPRDAQEMWDLWIEDVDRRVAEEASAPLVDMDSAPVLDKKLLEDENGDYLFKAPDRVAAPVRVDVTSPTADTFEDIMEAADMAEDIPFNPTPFEEFFASAIVRMTPEQVVLSDLLVYGPKDAPERIGQNDLAAVTKVASLSVKISELCGLGDDSHLSVSLGEIVLRLLFGDESGLPSDAFCIALNNAITQKDRNGRDSNRFDANVCSIIKQLGTMVKEMCADG